MVIIQQLARFTDGSGWYIKTKTKTQRERTVWLPEPFLSALRELRDAETRRRRPTGGHLRSHPGDADMGDLVFLPTDGGLITLNRDNDEWKKL